MSWKEELDKCTHDGKFHWITCWGIAHTLGMLALLTVAWLMDESIILPAYVAGSLIVIVHELGGPGGLLSGIDRILDWVLPIAVGGLFVHLTVGWYYG